MRTITGPEAVTTCLALRREGVTFMPTEGDDHPPMFTAHMGAWHASVQEVTPGEWTLRLSTPAGEAAFDVERDVGVDYVAAKWGPLLRSLAGLQPEIVSGGGGAFLWYVTMRTDLDQRRYVVRADTAMSAERLAATRCRTGRVMSTVACWRWQ
ncbi:hypothetical protein [Mycobacterium sp.]|uniref:hypothetical protein n=1 Tax=Mycobacterium sp. TaxID=1785 RepID=UPI0026148A22|nr:hypothetical protein [Mycobacterium sp.]